MGKIGTSSVDKNPHVTKTQTACINPGVESPICFVSSFWSLFLHSILHYRLVPYIASIQRHIRTSFCAKPMSSNVFGNY